MRSENVRQARGGRIYSLTVAFPERTWNGPDPSYGPGAPPHLERHCRPAPSWRVRLRFNFIFLGAPAPLTHTARRLMNLRKQRWGKFRTHPRGWRTSAPPPAAAAHRKLRGPPLSPQDPTASAGASSWMARVRKQPRRRVQGSWLWRGAARAPRLTWVGRAANSPPKKKCTMVSAAPSIE
ncbi:uncharacterized protein Tco025E_09740, partial [Trypanosoma conorhini]